MHHFFQGIATMLPQHASNICVLTRYIIFVRGSTIAEFRAQFETDPKIWLMTNKANLRDLKAVVDVPSTLHRGQNSIFGARVTLKLEG